METKNKFEIPFLTDSKPMMLEAIVSSKRVSALTEIIFDLDIYAIQRLFLKVFNKIEREFLLQNWHDLGIRHQLRTKSEHEALPENWFREND